MRPSASFRDRDAARKRKQLPTPAINATPLLLGAVVHAWQSRKNNTNAKVETLFVAAHLHSKGLRAIG